MAKAECALCRVVRGEVEQEIVDEGPSWLAFLDARPVMPWHVLLVPRTHVEHLWDLEPTVAAEIGVGLQRVAARIEERLQPAGLTVFQANRAAGWQSVPHVHFHLVPRQPDDPLVPSWTARAAPVEQVKAAECLLLD